MKKFRSSFFLLSEAAGIVASSVYGLTLSFIVQRYVDSQFLNSLVSNISVTLSMLMAFFTGYIVDKKSPWKLILLSDLVLIPLFIIPIFLFEVSIPLFLISIVIIDMISIVVSELDEISRPVYLSLITTKEKSVSVLQSINIVDSAFAIVGYLFVFLTISFLKINTYFIIVSICYLFSALFIFHLPKETKEKQPLSETQESFILALRELLQVIVRLKQVGLYLANLLFMVKNQIVMSLLIFRIGQIDKGFTHIHIIGIGILLSVAGGAVLNKILYLAKVSVRKVLSMLLIACSGYFTYLVGHAQTVEHFLLFGLAIGAIFGTGLPCFGLLSAERMLVTPDNHQGKSLSLLRTSSVVLTLSLTACFAIVEKLCHLTTIFFDGSAVLAIILVLLFFALPFTELNSVRKNSNK